MSLPPAFSLDTFYYPVFMVLYNDSYKLKNHVEPTLAVNSKIAKVPRKRGLFGLRLAIKTPDDMDMASFPYTIAISIYGRFLCNVSEEIDKETYLFMRRTVYVNGSSILYSAARDRLMLFTGGYPSQPYCLPTHRFDPNDIKS